MLTCDEIGDGQPWLSVVMPVFNGAETIHSSLSSLCGDTRGLEVIIVDQGSTDESLDIVCSFSDRLPIRVFEKPENQNWMQNTNYGFSVAKAPFATMLHQDDVWFPHRLDLLKRLYWQCPEAALWVHSSQYIDEAGRRLGRFGPPFGRRVRTLTARETLPKLIVQNTISLPTAMFRTAEVQGNGGLDEALWYTADWDLWLRLCALGPLVWSPVAATGFRLTRGSQTISGSRDTKDFAHQLAVPVARHGQQMSDAILKRAVASNAINVWLATRHHGGKPSFVPLARQLFKLGPVGWFRLLKDTRIVVRSLARLRAGL